ncbi:hypothetical protein ACH5RR_003383 [Cinchona calisaya]|uniref:RNase H type-1 domain-containing protein n=1 Tax=Cinchona calisaya TaxID=153742 RepID=A0ABD3AUL7_9GENT
MFNAKADVEPLAFVKLRRRDISFWFDCWSEDDKEMNYPSSWYQTNLTSQLKIQVMEWLSPPTPYYQLNSDGAFKQGQGIASGGGVIRDCNGDIVAGFSLFYSNSQSSLKDEALALLDKINQCR